MAEASGKSKQEAETKAAQIVLEQLQTNNSS
jgi:dsRNA-specific ribonuclease